MREISAQEIARVVRDLCIEANRRLPQDVETAVRTAADRKRSLWPARSWGICWRICRRPGSWSFRSVRIRVAVVFADVGQEVHITGGLLADAVNKGGVS